MLLTNQLDFSILPHTERLADDVLEGLDTRARSGRPKHAEFRYSAASGARNALL